MQDINVYIDGKVLKKVETKKSLGVLIDEHLCWDKQIDNISKKASKGIGHCLVYSLMLQLKLSNISSIIGTDQPPFFEAARGCVRLCEVAALISMRERRARLVEQHFVRSVTYAIVAL